MSDSSTIQQTPHTFTEILERAKAASFSQGAIGIPEEKKKTDLDQLAQRIDEQQTTLDKTIIDVADDRKRLGRSEGILFFGFIVLIIMVIQILNDNYTNKLDSYNSLLEKISNQNTQIQLLQQKIK